MGVYSGCASFHFCTRERTARFGCSCLSFSGLPDGEYWVLKFASEFEKASSLSEILVLTEEQGQLKVTAYFIQ